jgi:hypothetical protein
VGTFAWEPRAHPDGCRDRAAHEHGISTYTCPCGGHWQQWQSQLPTRDWASPSGERLRATARLLGETLAAETDASCEECVRLHEKRRGRAAGPAGLAGE